MSARPRPKARPIIRVRLLPVIAMLAGTSLVPTAIVAQHPVVPGYGIRVEAVGDDFEDPNWLFNYNHPKSARNINKRENGPLGTSANRRWLEGPHRGTPDVLERVSTPAGGLADSTGSLLIRTIHPGIPKQITFKPQQDDIMISVRQRLGSSVPAAVLPNCTVRVYVPPFDKWEDRTGSSFGFRADCWGYKPGKRGLEQYWPGMFINFRSSTSKNIKEDSAFLSIRADALGRDIRGPEVKPGWWTLGLSVTADGMCHFYAHEGVADLTEKDHLASYYCYGFRAQRFDLFFFNVVTMDNGKTWSTPWIIDDPTFFAATPLVAAQPRRTSRSRR